MSGPERITLAVTGASGMPYAPPASLTGMPLDLGFMILPVYRAWVVVAALIGRRRSRVGMIAAIASVVLAGVAVLMWVLGMARGLPAIA